VDLGLSLLKLRSTHLGRIIDDVSVMIFAESKPLEDRMKQARVEEADIREAARELHGLERLDQARYAVLERDGQISILQKT
jgi:uncharacterized membrane protein YcaP (DUF421 family)